MHRQNRIGLLGCSESLFLLFDLLVRPPSRRLLNLLLVLLEQAEDLVKGCGARDAGDGGFEGTSGSITSSSCLSTPTTPRLPSIHPHLAFPTPLQPSALQNHVEGLQNPQTAHVTIFALDCAKEAFRGFVVVYSFFGALE